MMFELFLTSFALGIGLAMDAFSVSLANGLNDSSMKSGRMCGIAGVFAFFQAAMPMIGWICVHTIAEKFSAFEKFIPWIALILLAFIGGKMIYESVKGCDEEGGECGRLTFTALLVQGVATSIDALSVGFTIAERNFVEALICVTVIAAVTFVICMGGLYIGKKFGTKLANRAGMLGGIILVVIGVYIFVSGMGWL